MLNRHLSNLTIVIKWSTAVCLIKQIGRNCLTVTNTTFGLFYVVYVLLLLWCGLTNSLCSVSSGTVLQFFFFTEITGLWDWTDNIKDQRFDANSWSNTGTSTVTNTYPFCVTFYTVTVLLIERLIIFSIYCSFYHISFHIKFSIIHRL